MRLLLDTHVLIWSQESPLLLGLKTRKLLRDEEHDLFVSAVCALEISRLMFLGRITLKVELGTWLNRACRSLKAMTRPIDKEIAVGAYQLPGSFHKDPADRMLVATARLDECHLLTADDLILKYPHVKTLDARR